MTIERKRSSKVISLLSATLVGIGAPLVLFGATRLSSGFSKHSEGVDHYSLVQQGVWLNAIGVLFLAFGCMLRIKQVEGKVQRQAD